MPDLNIMPTFPHTLARRSADVRRRESVSPMNTSLCAVTMRLFPLATKIRGGWFPFTLLKSTSTASARQDRWARL